MGSLKISFRQAGGGWIAGVCHALGRITGLNANVFRVGFGFGLFFSFWSALLLYFALFGMMQFFTHFRHDEDAAPAGAGSTPRLGALARTGSVATTPATSLLAADYAALDRRLVDLEAEALSRDHQTRRRFKEAGLG